MHLLSTEYIVSGDLPSARSKLQLDNHESEPLESQRIPHFSRWTGELLRPDMQLMIHLKVTANAQKDCYNKAPR
jgi:hypothetical protein